MSQWPISKYAKQVSCGISELQIPDSVVKCLLLFIKNALQYSHAAPNANKCANISNILIDAYWSPPTMFSIASILLMLNIPTLPLCFLPFVTDLHLVLNIINHLLVSACMRNRLSSLIRVLEKCCRWDNSQIHRPVSCEVLVRALQFPASPGNWKATGGYGQLL